MNQFNRNAFTSTLLADAICFRALQNMPKEHVCHEEAKQALAVLEGIRYCTPADYYLGCASINLLNTYVKQSDSTIGYWFKNYVYPMMEAMVEQPQQGLCWSFTIDRRMTVGQLELFGMVQFSYHCLKRTPAVDTLLDRQTRQGITPAPWDGIRKQQCACTVFHRALEAHSRFGTPISGR